MEILEGAVCKSIYNIIAKMSSNFFSVFTIKSVMYMLILQEAKVQDITLKGTLGECQLLNLKNNGKPPASFHVVVWKKGTTLIGKMKGQSAATCKRDQDRCHVLNNGSLKLCPTLRGDGGQYTAEAFTEHGEHLYKHSVQLELTEDKVQDITIKGTLGDCQLLNLENNRKPIVHIHEVVWKKDIVLMGKMEGQNATACERYRDRCHVLKNGSLKLCPTLSGDGGQYTADVFTEHGEHLYNQTFQLELIESEKTTNYPHLLFLIKTGVCVATFLLMFGSTTYYFGKWKNKPEKKHPTLQKQQSTEIIEGSQRYLFIQQEETVAAVAATAASHDIEYTVPIKISTFKGK